MGEVRAAVAAGVGAALVGEFGAEYADTDPLIRPSAFADFQSNVAIALAKRLGRPPSEIAGLIAERLSGSPMFERAEVSGPGFINITVRDAWLGDTATAQLSDPRLGVETTGRPQREVVDYSAPNVAKAMHRGHLRTTIVGEAFARGLERLGQQGIRANDHADWRRYLQQDGIATISDGALVAFPPGFTGRDGNPLPLILRKSDGGYGYGTTDMAAIRYRVNELHADRITYVVGSEQSQHLSMVFAVARQAGWLPDSVRAEHAPIGMVTGADRKRFRSRTGESVKLIDLIDEAVARAEKVIKDRYDDPELRAQIAEAVGIGALKYADLSVARDSSYALDWNRIPPRHVHP